MSLHHLIVEHDGPIATVTLNRPERRNSLALDVMLELTAVLRDLTWLLNAVQPMLAAEVLAAPQAAQSVLNYGMPPLSGQLASKVDMPGLTQSLREAILRFEPRILEQSLEVRAVDDQLVIDAHNVIEFEIRGHLWAQPIPLELLLRTQLDLEAGQVRVRDVAPTTFDMGRR